MNNEFISLPFADFEILFSRNFMKGSGFLDKKVDNSLVCTFEYEEKNISCLNVSVALREFYDCLNENQVLNYVLLDKNDFPKISNYFKDKNTEFALAISQGQFQFIEVPLENFTILEDKIGKLFQKKGIMAFCFNKDKIQYLVDLELFIKSIMEAKE